MFLNLKTIFNHQFYPYINLIFVYQGTFHEISTFHSWEFFVTKLFFFYGFFFNFQIYRYIRLNMYNCYSESFKLFIKFFFFLKVGGGGRKGKGGDKVNKKHLYNLYPTGVMKFIIGL